MRGQIDPRDDLRAPRRIKEQMDAVLGSMSPQFEAMYASTGRPSIAPERLLKASVLTALYSVRSDRLFCEMLNYNLLFRWFLDMDLEGRSFDHSTSSKNRGRLIEHDIAKGFFCAVIQSARGQQQLSDEHFAADGTLIEAWASFKSLKPKDGPPPPNGRDDTGMVDFRGERRSNATQVFTTDPQAKLMRKGNGQPAKLIFGAHAVTENRNWLLVDLYITESTLAEPKAASTLLDRRRFARQPLSTLGADKGYPSKAFMAVPRRCDIRPNIARIESRRTPGLDERTTRHGSYRVGRRKPKRIE